MSPALGEALYAARDSLPTYRSHNEQAMGLSAVAYAKASRRRRMMVCTSSIGPGATNMVTAAAVASVNRLPVLFLPGDVFANRRPDPVLQQVEDFGDGTISANDCFKPVSRYFDRITRPEQIVPALTRAIAVLTDPAECGPVTLAFCQDVQAEAYDYPESFFEERLHRPRRQGPDAHELKEAVAALRAAKKPFVISGGGVLYSDAEKELLAFCQKRGIPMTETQAGKSAIPADHELSLGAVGVTGTGAADKLAAGSRRHPRRRHAPRRFHHRLLGAVPESGAPLHRPQRAAVRRDQASRLAAGRRRARRPRRARRGARRLEGAGRLARSRPSPPRPNG